MRINGLEIGRFDSLSGCNLEACDAFHVFHASPGSGTELFEFVQGMLGGFDRPAQGVLRGETVSGQFELRRQRDRLGEQSWSLSFPHLAASRGSGTVACPLHLSDHLPVELDRRLKFGGEPDAGPLTSLLRSLGQRQGGDADAQLGDLIGRLRSLVRGVASRDFDLAGKPQARPASTRELDARIAHIDRRLERLDAQIREQENRWHAHRDYPTRGVQRERGEPAALRRIEEEIERCHRIEADLNRRRWWLEHEIQRADRGGRPRRSSEETRRLLVRLEHALDELDEGLDGLPKHLAATWEVRTGASWADMVASLRRHSRQMRAIAARGSQALPATELREE